MASLAICNLRFLLLVAILSNLVCTIDCKIRSTKKNKHLHRAASLQGNVAEQTCHKKPEVTKLLQQFHDKYARQPMKAIDEAKPTHTKYIKYLANELRKLGIARVEYTGSAYEGVKVSNDIEFDIMMIKTAGNVKPVQTSTSGYYYLQEDDGRSRSNVSPDKMVADFRGTLQKLINSHPDMSRLVKLRKHGPAVQMDVYESEVDKKQTKPWYTVDVVLSYQAKLDQRKRIFVAKPLKCVECERRVNDAWRMSYSLEEKDLFNGMDRDNGCRKKVLRILKVWRNREAGMFPLTSYHLKTALFYEMKEVSNWSQSELGRRLIGVLRRLHKATKQGRQPHYFVPKFNLLGRMRSTTIANIRDRLEHILRHIELIVTPLLETNNSAVAKFGARSASVCTVS